MSSLLTLTLNAGSSSIKFAIFNDKYNIISKGGADGINRENSSLKIDNHYRDLELKNHEQALKAILKNVDAKKINNIGHRIVHGGDKWSKPTIINNKIINDIKSIISLAPQHIPHQLSAIRACSSLIPDIPQVACFDTAFHLSQLSSFTTPPLPSRWSHLKRYGFHGLSYQHIVEHIPSINNQCHEPLPSRILAAHLGNGASLCAIVNGKSMATTMGFSTLDGLIMGSRCGNLDPGIILHLINNENVPASEVAQELYNNSGLLALSRGISADMRVLLSSNKKYAKLAIDAFVSSIVRNSGGLISLMGGIDALVFTGGIGENSHQIRDKVSKNLALFGVNINDKQNISSQEGIISSQDSKVKVFIVKANEEKVIAKSTRHALSKI